MEKPYKLIDLFCGAGGMSLGFLGDNSKKNFKSILAIDNDASACATYNANFGDHCITTNVESWLLNNEVPEADAVIGGPPCQGFSLLNKNREGDFRRALWEPYLDIVEKSQASVFVMENVPGLLKSPEFQDIVMRSKDHGFEVLSASVLNTADYGVPQTRRRTIIIGYRPDHFPADFETPAFPPSPTHRSPTNSNHNLPEWRSVKEFISDLPDPEGVQIRNIAPPLDLHFGRTPTPVSLERYRAVPPGGNRFDLQERRPDITPACWIRKKSGGTDLFGRLWWNRPSVTIRTEFFKPEKGRYLHPEADRPITHREAARLMSFPDTFVFVGSKIEVARQIGNAVPPIFAQKIAAYVQELLGKRVTVVKQKEDKPLNFQLELERG
ncbi:DNA cytosine methyltransferase [Salinicola rhizosphaerae]|uniref:Cytosine-specific methyltransferase n=1 Tax=Salinicola rhizosphaerae TaxID=1443141 RepID=A0ABQ3DTS0_9GAMM|nr:DNA cytosine methyltransferase [Salinicola rhizosphaerae]GHB12807.1 cytosine-specific methyltransferase [Salinicola rhizosphaerae]